MTDINLKTLSPDTSLPTTGVLFGADSQGSGSPSVYGVTTAITAILGNAASSDALVFNSDTTFSRRAAANLRFGNADAASPVAQTLSVQSVVAGTSNTAGTAFTINGAQGTGTGAGGSIVFQVAPAGGSGTAQNALAAALTISTTAITNTLASPFSSPYLTGEIQWAGSGSLTFTADGLATLRGWGSDFGRLRFGGTTSSFPALKRSTTTLQARLADDSAFTNIQGKLTTDNAYAVGGVLAATGSITIYDSTGTAYRVPCLV